MKQSVKVSRTLVILVQHQKTAHRKSGRYVYMDVNARHSADWMEQKLIGKKPAFIPEAVRQCQYQYHTAK